METENFGLGTGGLVNFYAGGADLSIAEELLRKKYEALVSSSFGMLSQTSTSEPPIGEQVAQNINKTLRNELSYDLKILNESPVYEQTEPPAEFLVNSYVNKLKPNELYNLKIYKENQAFVYNERPSRPIITATDYSEDYFKEALNEAALKPISLKPSRRSKQAQAAKRRVNFLRRPALLDAMRLLRDVASDSVTAFRAVAEAFQDERTVKKPAFLTKRDEHRTLTPYLAALHARPESRRLWHGAIDEAAMQDTETLLVKLKVGPLAVSTLVVGSGPHAAAFVSSLRAENPDEDILVLDQDRLGGQFAKYGTEEIFDLNSRTRPSNLAALEAAGQNGNINPMGYNAVMQLPDITGDQYAGQNDISDVARTNIILSANVGVGIEVKSVNQDSLTGEIQVIVQQVGNPEATYEINPKNVVMATGLGEHKKFKVAEGLEVVDDKTGFAPYMTSTDFMKTLGNKKGRGEIFPLTGIKKVAVVGAGDSGRIVLEQILGQSAAEIGPAQAGRAELVTWYGTDVVGKVDYLKSSRGRYARIGTEINSDFIVNENQRIRTSAARISDQDLKQYEGSNRIFIFGESYDLVIDARGFDNVLDSIIEFPSVDEVDEASGSRKLGDNIFAIGPAAELIFEQQALAGIPENSASLYNYIPISEQLGRVISKRSRLQRTSSFISTLVTNL